MSGGRLRAPLELIAIIARRGTDDLTALAQIARGRPADPERVRALTRAGVLRAGGKLPAVLLVPVLALDAALGLTRAERVRQMTRMMAQAPDPPAREQILDSLAEELAEQLDALRDG